MDASDAVTAVPPGRVVFGIQLPVQAQSRIFVEDWELTAGPEEMARVARTADACGYFYVSVCDHVAIPARAAATMGTVWYDTVATLGWLAGVTERVRLLSSVYVLPYRHPFQAAKSFATLDTLSAGRVILGVGTGHVAEEFAALGVDQRRRGALLDAAVDAVVDAWTHEFTDGVAVGPRPVQKPRPPVWVGGSSPAALRRAAARGDGWLPQGTPRRDMPDQVKYLLDCRDEMRPGQPIDVGAMPEPVYVGDAPFDDTRRLLTGPADRIAEPLRELAALGVNHIQVRLRSRSCTELEDQLEAFARDVAPLVQP